MRFEAAASSSVDKKQLLTVRETKNLNLKFQNKHNFDVILARVDFGSLQEAEAKSVLTFRLQRV